MVPVSPARAVTIPAVYRALSILATSASQLEIGAQRDGRWITISPAHLLSQPNPFQPLAQFIKRTVVSLGAHGQAFLKVTLLPDGRNAAAAEVLDPLRCAIRYDEHGRKWLDHNLPTGLTETLASSRFRHLRLLELPGMIDGLGPIQACRLSIAGSIDLRDYAAGWFRDGAVPTGVLTSDQQLTPTDAGQMKDRWHELQQTRDVAVLGKGTSYEPIVLKPADAQFLESQQFSVADIARMFGIPAAYLLAEVNGNSMTYQSLEQADSQYLRYTLMQYLGEIESALSTLLPRGQVAKFKVDGLLRPDTLTRAKVHQIYRAAGVMTVNEIRAVEGLDPIPGGDDIKPPTPPSPPALPDPAADPAKESVDA